MNDRNRTWGSTRERMSTGGQGTERAAPTGRVRAGRGFWGLLVTCVLLVSAVPVGAEPFGSLQDVEFTWSVENDDPGPSGTLSTLRCLLASSDALDNSTPCEVHKYEIGNSNTHVFFRWTLGTIDFDPMHGSDLRLELTQAFRGSGWEEEPSETWFEFTGHWDLGDSLPVTGSSVPAHWADAIVWDVATDDREVTAAVPLDLVGPMLDGDATPGSHFNVTMNPSLTLIDDLSFLPGVQSPQDEIRVNRTDWQGTFWLSPYLDLQPPPGLYYQNVTEFPFEASVGFDAPTIRKPWVSDLYQWNWTTADPVNMVVSLDWEVVSGSMGINITDPHGNTWAPGSANGSFEDTLSFVEGDWSLAVKFDEFVGNVRIAVDTVELTEEEAQAQKEEDAPELEDASAPGWVFVAVAVTALGGLLVRRRTR